MAAKTRKAAERETERFPPLSTSLKTFLRDGGDEEFRQTIYGLLQVSALMLKARERYGSFIGVSGPQYSILAAIAERGETTVRELADILHVSSPFVTAESGKMIRAGFVEKRPNLQDRRSSFLSLTETGCALIRKVSPIRQVANDIIFGSLSEAEAKSLRRIVGMMVSDLKLAIHELHSPSWSVPIDHQDEVRDAASRPRSAPSRQAGSAR